MDYTSTPITATFTAGTTSTRIDIPVTMDDIVERTETFQLQLSLPLSMKYAVKLTHPNRVTAVIIDSSSMYVYSMVSHFYPLYMIVDSSVTFSGSSYSFKENDGYMQVNMVLRNPASFDITLFIVPKSNTATGNADIIRVYFLTYKPYRRY